MYQEHTILNVLMYNLKLFRKLNFLLICYPFLGMTMLSMTIKEVTEVIGKSYYYTFMYLRSFISFNCISRDYYIIYIGRKIIEESGKMVRDLTETIESCPEIILETGGKQIGLGNKGFAESIISNQFLFLFIME